MHPSTEFLRALFELALPELEAEARTGRFNLRVHHLGDPEGGDYSFDVRLILPGREGQLRPEGFPVTPETMLLGLRKAFRKNSPVPPRDLRLLERACRQGATHMLTDAHGSVLVQLAIFGEIVF